MTSAPRYLALVLMFWTHAALAQTPSQSPVPSDAEIRRLLVERIDTQHQGVGIVVGVIEPQGRRVIAYGAREKGDNRPLDGDTLFEIGSITKVFTALLLADMAQRGEVALDDPVGKYLPDGVKVPERGGRAITLLDLATHTSGLPRLPSNLRPKDPANPYADYSVERLYRFLSTYQLPRSVGSKYEYSNVGFGLLGHALERRAGVAYETLVDERISSPLGMASTRVTLTPELRSRLAVGHNAELAPAPNWDLPTLAGAGALRSTANDLLTFLAANLGYVDSPLSEAMKAMLTVKRSTGAPFMDVVLGWQIDTRGGNELIWHNGGTGGYRTFIGYSAKSRVGIVALSNTSTAAGVDDIALHLFDSRYPLAVPPDSPRQVAVDPALLDRYVGRYELTSNFVLTITREQGRLFVQATGQPRYQVYPMSDRRFFLKVVDAQIAFEPEVGGRSPALVLHQNGQDQTAKRIGN